MERVEVPGWSHIIGMPVKLDESLAVNARAAPVCVGPTICQRSWALLVSASNTTGVGSVTVKPKRSTTTARPIVPVAASPNTTAGTGSAAGVIATALLSISWLQIGRAHV